MKIVEFLLQTLEKQGVRFIFGNPGTTEIPLVRACEQRPKLTYVVALSEVAAVPMADGYARATRSLGVLNLHVAPGLGNGMGALYTAGIAQTPLLVLIGGQDRRFLHTQPILWGPVEKMASTIAKAVFGLNSRYDAAFNIRRALRSALTAPFAPVALVCPPDLLEQEIDAKPEIVNPPALAGISTHGARDFWRLLTKAKRPALIAAEDVYWNGAGATLEQLARRIAAPVHIAPYTAALPISSHSPCYAGYLPPSHKQIGERLAPHDALFFVGGKGIRTTLYSEAELPQPKFWIGNDPTVSTVGGEFTLAVVADTRQALGEILRATEGTARKNTNKPSRPSVPVPGPQPDVLHPSRVVNALLKAFSNAIWIDESGLSTSDVRQWMRLRAGEYFINGSGGIGWGLAASVGAALGNPARQVVAIVGDGSALYASEALWTAAHHRLKLLVIVLANRRYATLNEAAGRLAGQEFNSFTIEPPVLNFGGLATLYGWRYTKVTSEGDLSAFVSQAGSKLTANTLLEITLDPAVKPVTASRHF